MYSELPATALDDFLRLAAPFAKQVVAPPVDVNELDKGIRNEARSACLAALAAEKGGWPTAYLFRLRKIVELAIHLGRNVDKEWLLLYEVFESLATAKECKSLDDELAWSVALEEAVRALNHSSYRHSTLSGSREEVVAKSFATLKRQGFPYTLDGRGAHLTRPAYSKICARIEDKIKRSGGRDTANMILEIMQRIGRIADGSLIHARTPSQLKLRPSVPGTPWHYIYNLAIKHIDVPRRANNSQVVLSEMEKLARDFAATIDVETHSSYENMSFAGLSLAGIIHETTLYDELFAFPQWQPLGGQRLVSLWLDALSDAGCDFPSLSANEWKSIAACLIARARPSSIEPISSYDLVSAEVERARADVALDLLSGAAGQINVRYRTPTDTAERTSTWFPIIRTRDRRYFVQPKGVAARAFCERLYRLMRDARTPDLDRRMGKGLEQLTIKSLAEWGIVPSVVNKKYAGALKGTTYEVDIAVESDDRIFLIECTKKPLTSAARAGGTIAALQDLNASFLKLVQQLARHEAELRTKGAIRFLDGSLLECKGRSIEKIGVNLFDHGSLQNRDFTIALIEVMAGARLGTSAAEAKTVVSDINEQLSKFNDCLMMIFNSESGAADRTLFRFVMSTWWLSIDQLHYLLTKGGGEIWNSVRGIRHLTSRSGDIVYELRNVTNLDKAGREMLAFAQQQDNRVMI